MSPDSPLEAYWAACERFLQIQEFVHGVVKLERMRELQPEWESCVRKLMAVAETPDVEVWHALGDAFANGRGTERSREEAARWFQRAAEAGHTRSMIRMG